MDSNRNNEVVEGALQALGAIAAQLQRSMMSQSQQAQPARIVENSLPRKSFFEILFKNLFALSVSFPTMNFASQHLSLSRLNFFKSLQLFLGQDQGAAHPLVLRGKREVCVFQPTVKEEFLLDSRYQSQSHLSQGLL